MTKTTIHGLQVAVLLITVVAFTAAFFPQRNALVSPELLDLVQYANLNDTTGELLANAQITTPNDVTAYLTLIADRLGYGDDLRSTEGPEARLESTNGEGGALSLRLHPAHTILGNKSSLEISLNQIHLGILADTESDLRKMVDSLRPTAHPSVLVTITGTKPSDQIGLTALHYIEDLFAQAKGQIIEGISEDGLNSWSGYTPDIPSSTKVGKNKLNLQIASRYSSDRSNVIIKIGTPLIAGTY